MNIESRKSSWLNPGCFKSENDSGVPEKAISKQILENG